MLSLSDIFPKLHIVAIFLIADSEIIPHRLLNVQTYLCSIVYFLLGISPASEENIQYTIYNIQITAKV